MPDGPAGNISGGASGGGRETAFDPTGPKAATRTEVVVDRLDERYWRKTYGKQGGFRCLVRTILSQNTSGRANQPAHDELMAQYDGGDLAESLAAIDREGVVEAIRSDGLYNQKSKLIQGVAEEVLANFGSEADFDRYVREEAPAAVRDRLLEMKGVGPKTADCILLFAGGRGGVFPVDTHVHRIARRIGLAPADADHEGVRAALERGIPDEKYGFGHTTMIQFGHEFCKARKPACLDDPEACPMTDVCDMVGVDAAAQSVTGPTAAGD